MFQIARRGAHTFFNLLVTLWSLLTLLDNYKAYCGPSRRLLWQLNTISQAHGHSSVHFARQVTVPRNDSTCLLNFAASVMQTRRKLPRFVHVRFL